MLATRYLAHKERLQFKGFALLFCLTPIIWVAMLLSPNAYVALLLLSISALGGTMSNGPLFGAIQTLVPPRMRAMAIAILLLFANLIGLGLGPLAAGAISDTLHPYLGINSLRYALVTLCPSYFVGAWLFWRASNSAERDMSS